MANNPNLNVQMDRIRGEGFIAALDQSGGSTPKALANYGVEETAYSSEEEMFKLVHDMRTRIITSPSFDGRRIMGAILFKETMEREIEGTPTANFLWETKSVVPFLKIDSGLADEADGVQMMKPMPALDDLLDRANEKQIFGTKMRSVVKAPNEAAINAIVKQQFDTARQILAKGLVPIIEPEVDINAPAKAECEALLRDALQTELDALEADLPVMFKLTLPDAANFYASLAESPKTLRVVALSGGYDIDTANAMLRQNNGMAASFSRALSERLNVNQSADEFDQALDSAVEEIFQASIT